MALDSPPELGAGPRLGTVVLIATIAVAALGLTVAVIQLDNALDGRVRDRTPLGVALMAIGFLGPAVALAALSRRHALRQKGLQQWGSLTLFPGFFLILWVTVFVVYWASGTVGQPIIPHTPTFSVRINAEGRPHFHALDGFREGQWSGDSSFDFRISPPGGSGLPANVLTGTVTRVEGNRIEMRGELVLVEKVRLRVDGLAEGVLVIDDQPRVSPVLLEPGTYRVVVRGLPGG